MARQFVENLFSAWSKFLEGNKLKPGIKVFIFKRCLRQPMLSAIFLQEKNPVLKVQNKKLISFVKFLRN